jgi:hypothetical protein
VLGSAIAVAAAGSGVGSMASQAASKPSGTPIKIAVILPTGTSQTNYPEMLASSQAGAIAINKSGGIKGHPVSIIYCNEQNDANAATQCARQVVSDGVVAGPAVALAFHRKPDGVIGHYGECWLTHPRTITESITPTDPDSSFLFDTSRGGLEALTLYGVPDKFYNIKLYNTLAAVCERRATRSDQPGRLDAVSRR